MELLPKSADFQWSIEMLRLELLLLWLSILSSPIPVCMAEKHGRAGGIRRELILTDPGVI